MVEFKMNGHSSRKLYNHLKQVINHVYNNDAEKGPEEKKGKFGFGKKEKKSKEEVKVESFLASIGLLDDDEE
jgi:hypothetical protein